MPRRAALLVCLVAILVGSGCGGDSSPRPLGGPLHRFGAATTAPPHEQALPVILSCQGMEPEVRPPYLTFACGDAGILADVTWTTWTASEARGTGAVQINQCQPSCAAGTRKAFPASFTARRPAPEDGRTYFRDVVISFSGELPNGTPVITCPLSTPSVEGGCVALFTD